MKPGKLDSYSDLELALMIKLDVYGTGEARRKALGSRYAAAQAIVNQIGKTGSIPDGSARADPEKLAWQIRRMDLLDHDLRSLGGEVE